MTDEEKILALLAEMHAELKDIKAEIAALRPHVKSAREAEERRERLIKLFTEKDSLTPEELAEVNELERTIKENRRHEKNVVLDSGRRAAS